MCPEWTPGLLGWGAWIRTREWRNQNPLPYHLATPQCAVGLSAAACCRRREHSDAVAADQCWGRTGWWAGLSDLSGRTWLADLAGFGPWRTRNSAKPSAPG